MSLSRLGYKKDCGFQLEYALFSLFFLSLPLLLPFLLSLSPSLLLIFLVLRGRSCPEPYGEVHMARNWSPQPAASEELRLANNPVNEFGN